MKLVSTLFLILFININLNNFVKSKSEEINLQSDLKKDLEDISLIKKRSKILACMSIVRNSLAEGNNDLKEVIDNSPYDSSKTYDKVIVSMISHCEKSIKDSEMEKALTPENILTPVHSDSNLYKLIRFDKNFFKSANEALTFTQDELDILKEINESSMNFDTDVTLQEEEIGFMGLKLSHMGNWLYFFMSLGLFLVFVIIFGGLYLLKCKKKDIKKKKQK